MNRSRRLELWISGVLVVVCLLIPDVLFRQFRKAPTLGLVGVGPARSVSSGKRPPASFHEQLVPRRAEAAVSLAATGMSRLHLLAQAARHLFQPEQAKRLVFMLAAEAHPQAIAPLQPKTITLEPLSYVKKADGRVEATISFGERVQVVYEGQVFEVKLRVARISPSMVELVENSAPAAVPNLMAEIGQGVVQAPAQKARQAPSRPAAEAFSNPGANRRFAAGSAGRVSEPSLSQELGYVESADGRVEAIIADGEHVRLAPATKSFANSFRAPASTSAGLKAANTLPPLINPLDSFGQESQPVQTNSSTQEAGVLPLVASGSGPSSVGMLQVIRGNNGEPESDQSGILQFEPLADYSGSRLQPRDLAPVPDAGTAGSPMSRGATPPLPWEGRETPSPVNTLGYVEKAGGEKEAIVEVLGQVYLVHEGESLAEKQGALESITSSAAAQAMHMPSIAQLRPEILGFGARGNIQGIFGVQVGAFRDRSNAEQLKERIEFQFRPVNIQGFERGDGLIYRVRVGHESTGDAARALARNLRRANLATETFVVRLN